MKTQTTARREDGQVGLAAALRESIRAIHAQAERSGIVSDVLRGRATRFGYALLLRNLLPAYQEMERGLDRHRQTPGVGAFARRELYRVEALERDIEGLCGVAWSTELPLLPEGQCYAARVAAAANGCGARLIAHAYVRYLGDLSGGQILKRLLSRSLGLGPETLGFYDFPGIVDIDAFKSSWRGDLDRAGPFIGNMDVVTVEANVAFALNIDVSNAVQRATRRAGDSSTQSATGGHSRIPFVRVRPC